MTDTATPRLGDIDATEPEQHTPPQPLQSDIRISRRQGFIYVEITGQPPFTLTKRDARALGAALNKLAQ